MKNTESWANDILHRHYDMAANPTSFIGVRDAHRDAAALVRQLQAELQDARRTELELLEALKMARAELAGLPHSLGYEFTHLPKIDAAIGRAQSMAEAQGSGEVEYEFEVWQNGSLQASGSTSDYSTAKSEADHYAAMYGQEGGPVEVRLFMKRQITSPTSVPVEGEEILVNAAHDVYTLPLQPSGLSSGPRYVVHVPGPEQPAAVDDEPVAWPLASPEEADKGWTLDYRFIEQVERIASQRTDYTTSMEATEQVLIAANEVLRVSQPAAQQPAAVDVTYPTPRNRAEALALARLALAYLGVIDSHISAAITRCETDSATQPGPEALTMTADTIRALMVERDAARYRQWRDKMISQDHNFIEAMQDSLPDAVGRIRPPTADEWDAAIDATMQSASHHQEVPRG